MPSTLRFAFHKDIIITDQHPWRVDSQVDFVSDLANRMQDHGQERLIVVVKDERDLPVDENKSFPAVRSDWDVEAVLSGNLPRRMTPESRQLDSGGDQSELPRERPLRKRADLLRRETVPASSAGDDPRVAMRVMAEQYLRDRVPEDPRFALLAPDP